MYEYLEMPSPAWRMPLFRSPLPGMTVPMAACVLAAPVAVRIWPVTGFIALSVLPEHTVAPLLHPGT